MTDSMMRSARQNNSAGNSAVYITPLATGRHS